MAQEKKGLITLHTAVLLMGLAGLFAKWIHLPSVVIVLWRVIFSSLFLFIILRIQKIRLKLKERKDYALLAVAGAILAVHWTTFMQSIQTSTVAIGTLTISTFPLFVTFLEPILFKERLKGEHVMTAAVMLAGVLLIVPKFDFADSMTQGILWGMTSSFSYAVLSLMNRKFMENYPSTLTAFYEQGTAAVLLLPAFTLRPQAGGSDFLILLLLGIVFTAISHTLYIESLKYVKVQTAGIVSGLESVYSILAAFLLLGEVPSVRELAGGALILGAAFYTSIRAAKSII